jgi:sulfur-oxidizing protein SoxY
MARSEESWADFVGNSQGRIWREADGFARARLRIRHPMDTGLAKDNTPAYFIEKLDVKSSAGEPLATLELFEPVSEDPTLTLMLRIPAADGAVDVEGRDNNGETYRSTIPAPWRQSAVGAALPRC